MLWQHLTTMVIDKIRKMSVKGVKLKSESYFSISPDVLELWRKNLKGGGGFRPPVQIGLKFRSINVKIHVVDLHVLFLEFLITQRLFIKWDKVWMPNVEKIKDLLTMATFLE